MHHPTIVLSQVTDQLIKISTLALLSFLLAMALTPLYTFFAYRYRFWKKQRQTDTSGKELKVFTKLHAEKFKRHIPTMAGMIFVVAIVGVTLLLNLDREQTWLPLAALVGGAAVGLIDDIINLRGEGAGVAGLRSSVKFLLISLVGLVGAWFFFDKLGYDQVVVPFVGLVTIGWWIVPLFVLAVVSTGNAVNISDGLDGLSGGLIVSAYSFFAAIALLQGNFGIAGFCFTVVGAMLSYLWFNIHPARFFMGDVGSFALGTSLGVVAMLTNSILLLPVIGLVFVVETGSSLLQILSKKFLGRRIFISAPLHQHFEATGWPETKVTMRFWVVGGVVGFLGLLLALAGGSVK